MQLACDSWLSLSRLFDEAIQFKAHERQQWLETLPPHLAPLADSLRALLNSYEKIMDDEFLQLMPPVDLAEDLLIEWTPEPPVVAGLKIGPYLLEKQIGTGGMGTVWLAERSDWGGTRPIALKLPHKNLAGALVDRFERERDILASLTHPNIARLYDAGVSADGQPYLAMELVEGEPIIAYCDARSLNVPQRIQLFDDVLAAVQFAHGQLVIHRDIKPANILVTQTHEVKLLDFGIAKLHADNADPHADVTQFGERVLTPAYASPEQILGQRIGTASDQYSLAVLLYELLVGALPYRPARDSRASLEEAISDAECMRPSSVPVSDATARARGTTPKKLARQLAGDLETIQLKALKKRPEDRYRTVQEFRDDLKHYLDHEPVVARRDSLGYRARKFFGRHRAETLAASLAIIALLVFTVSLGIQLGRVTRERDRADRLARFMAHVFEVSDPHSKAAGTITARDLLDKASGEIESDLTRDAEQRARLVAAMARSYTNLGVQDRAESLLRRERQRAIAELGPNHAGTVALDIELLWELYASRQMPAALAFGQELLTRQQHVFAVDQMQIARIESYLAPVLGSVGRYAEAAAMGRHSVQIRRRAANDDDLELFEDEADVAWYRFRAGAGSAQEAEQLLRKVSEKYRARLGPGNPHTLSTMNRLAVVLSKEGRFADEVALLRSALTEGRRTVGPESTAVRDTLDNLAAALEHSGDLQGAESVIRESLEINTRMSGAGTPRAALAEYNLACFLAREGKKDQALENLEASVDDGLIPDAAMQMQSDDDLVSLRGEPRFQALVEVVAKKFGLGQQRAALSPRTDDAAR